MAKAKEQEQQSLCSSAKNGSENKDTQGSDIAYTIKM